MSVAPITPTEDHSESHANDWASRDIVYSAAFEDSVMRTVLAPPQPTGIVLLDEGEEPSHPSVESIPRNAVIPASLPSFSSSELPLSLDHPARRYRSSVPGINLTHPGGVLEGGPGPGVASESTAEDRREVVQDIIEQLGVRNARAFWGAVAIEKMEAIRELEERAHARRKAIRSNEAVERELDGLKEQRNLEVRVLQRRAGMGKG